MSKYFRLTPDDQKAIKHVLEIKRLDQRELACELGYKDSLFSKILHGKRGIEAHKLTHLYELLGRDVVWVRLLEIYHTELRDIYTKAEVSTKADIVTDFESLLKKYR